MDSHAHLDGTEFDADREQVIERARSAGVHHLMVIGTGATYREIGAALLIAEQIEGAYSAAGIHPHEAQHFLASDFAELRAMAQNPRFRAVGEIGLDYHYDHSPREAQREIFIRQLALARELKLPVLIHCREAWEDLRALLEQHWRGSGLQGILHCFTGSREEAFGLMDAGFMVSFAGNLTFKKSDGLREVARMIPVDRLLTETDCPFLAPVPHRGKRNEPAFVAEVLKQLAALRGVGEEALAEQVAENFKRMFS
ncbi:MAG TPA: TatD family hydrolase [Terriglobia bacterium]|nr:TatD family hydrolase [Terriglobia bacterium]